MGVLGNFYPKVLVSLQPRLSLRMELGARRVYNETGQSVRLTRMESTSPSLQALLGSPTGRPYWLLSSGRGLGLAHTLEMAGLAYDGAALAALASL